MEAANKECKESWYERGNLRKVLMMEATSEQGYNNKGSIEANMQRACDYVLEHNKRLEKEEANQNHPNQRMWQS